MVIKTSVIITNYNYGKYLGRSIRSCLNQSMHNSEYEIIVVDDGSDDDSRKILNSFNNRIKVLYTKHKGVAHASNVGIKEAIGMFVIRVDADDYINENMFLFMTEILIWNPDIGFVFCDHFIINQLGEKTKRIKLNTINKLFNHGAGIMFRKSYLESLGLYDVELKNHEDFDLLIRYLKNFDGYYLRLPLYRYFKHEGSLSDDSERNHWKNIVREKNKLDSDT